MSDLRASVRLAADARSRFRLAMDFALSRFIRVVPRSQRNRVREVRLRGDIKIRYRLNKGDLHSIREIWFEEDYRLPFEAPSGAFWISEQISAWQAYGWPNVIRSRK